MKKIQLLAVSFLLTLTTLAQSTFPFEVVLEPITIPNLPGIQSYASGEHNGKWLVLGGRLDGLHQRQPWQSFDNAGHNRDIYVIDPTSGTFYSAPLSGLNNDTLEAHLAATNHNFTQVGDYLYITGGYGLSADAVHITHPRITVIDVPAMLDSITANGTVPASAIQSWAYEPFAVTGGRLMHNNSTFYLVGGQRFDGQYNPMGHNTYVQTYTEAVRPFEISGTFPNLSADTLSYIVDADELHRRDYNVTYMTPNGTDLYFTAWSGVFQKTADLPFLNAVEVRDTGIYPVPNFAQYLNHYHCATLSLYGHSMDAMYTLFFGGIAQYFYNGQGSLVQDVNVPFVQTIGITEKRFGNYSETYASTQMPDYLGAGAEFFPAALPGLQGHILYADSIGTDTTLVGHIFGGIESPSANVFYSGQTNYSTATPTIYAVKLVRTSQIGLEEPTHQHPMQLQILPNPTHEKLNIQLVSNTPSPSSANVRIFNANGEEVLSRDLHLEEGRNNFTFKMNNWASGTYILHAESQGQQQRLTFVLN